MQAKLWHYDYDSVLYSTFAAVGGSVRCRREQDVSCAERRVQLPDWRHAGGAHEGRRRGPSHRAAASRQSGVFTVHPALLRYWLGKIKN